MDTVEKWMSKNLITIDENATIIEAMHMMREKEIRRLPVTRKGKFVGIVTDRMITEYTPGKCTALDTWEVHFILAKTAIKDVMNDHPYTVTPETGLIDAAQLIHDKKLYGLCVVDAGGNLVGIMTTTNMLEALINHCRSCG